MKKAIDKESDRRCSWANENDLLKKYHDEEWGVPVHDDKKHFEMLLLEGAQAGINWLTVLQKRDNYKKLFKGFDPAKVSKMTDTELEGCLKNEGIIRNRLKVYSARKNAISFLNIQREFGSFDKYIWQFFNEKQRINKSDNTSNLPTFTEESKQISDDLKKRGMTFVGPTIIYAYLQAVGIVNNHTTVCSRHQACLSQEKDFIEKNKNEVSHFRRKSRLFSEVKNSGVEEINEGKIAVQSAQNVKKVKLS